MLRLAWDVRSASGTLGSNWTNVEGRHEEHRMHNLITMKIGQQSRLRGGCQRFKLETGSRCCGGYLQPCATIMRLSGRGSQRSQRLAFSDL
jgi:hypothetical protein